MPWPIPDAKHTGNWVAHKISSYEESACITTGRACNLSSCSTQCLQPWVAAHRNKVQQSEEKTAMDVHAEGSGSGDMQLEDRKTCLLDFRFPSVMSELLQWRGMVSCNDFLGTPSKTRHYSRGLGGINA
jgi:hypothetical protein